MTNTTLSPSANYLAEVTNGYLRAALWSSIDDYGDPMDATFDLSYLADEARDQAEVDCERFVTAHFDDLATMDPSHVGMLFWFTRNGHGTGFWDDGLGEVGDRLTEASVEFGEVGLYEGDDGELYLS